MDYRTVTRGKLMLLWRTGSIYKTHFFIADNVKITGYNSSKYRSLVKYKPMGKGLSVVTSSVLFIIHLLSSAMQRGHVSSAEIFTRVDDESMVLLEAEDVGVQVVLEQCPQFLVGQVRGAKAVAIQDAAGIGIHDEHGFLAGVEQNVVCGFGPDAVDLE